MGSDFAHDVNYERPFEIIGLYAAEAFEQVRGQITIVNVTVETGFPRWLSATVPTQKQ